jgi:hypothetical protein
MLFYSLLYQFIRLLIFKSEAIDKSDNLMLLQKLVVLLLSLDFSTAFGDHFLELALLYKLFDFIKATY